MAKQTNLGESPATVRVPAPATNMPMNKQIERLSGVNAPFTAKYPEVRGGICEYCGVIDPNYPSEMQYKLCQHYRGKQLQCSYCPETKQPDDVINHSTLQVRDHPTNPNALVVWCNSYECSRKHEERFKVSA